MTKNMISALYESNYERVWVVDTKNRILNLETYEIVEISNILENNDSDTKYIGDVIKENNRKYWMGIIVLWLYWLYYYNLDDRIINVKIM